MKDKKAKKLLLVEDEAIIALNEKMTLEKFGYQVTTVHSGEKAVESVERDPGIELVLMDIDLGPGLPGDEAAEKILEIRHLPIVFLTSHTEREYVERVKEITRYGYVIKNSGKFVLWDTIEVAFELFEANERLERFFYVNLDLLCIADTEGNFIRVNQAWEEVLGHTVEELEQSKFLDFVHPEDLQPTLDAMRRLREQEEVIDFVNRYRSKDGSYRFVEWRSHPSGNIIYAAARDVTERVEYENALRQSERAYRDLFERAPIGIFRTNSNGRLLAANRAMAQIVGLDSPEQALAHYTDLGSQLYLRRERREEFITALERDGYVQEFEYEALRADGQRIWVSMNARKSEKATTDGFEIEGFFVDITERKQREQANKESESRFRSLVEHAPDAIFVQTNQAFSYVNQAALELFGAARPEELLGTPVVDRFHPLHRDMVRGRIRKLNEERTPVPRIEETCLRLDGTEVPAEVSAAPFDYQGEAGGLVFIRDITERKRAETAVKQYAQWLELTMTAANMAWWQMDVQTGAVSFDEQKTRMLGYTAEGFDHYESFTNLLHPDDYDRAMEAMKSHLRGDTERYDVEYRIKTSSGEYIWFHDVGAVITRNDAGKPTRVAGIVMDISERKHDQEQIETLLTQKDLLLNEVHHRIKNNMHTMMSLLSLEGQSTEDPGVTRALEDARSRLQSMEVLYEKLFQSGEYQVMSLSDYLPPLIDDMVRLSPEGARVTVTTEVEPIRMDVKSLSSLGLIVTELITNALKHGFRDRTEGRIEVSVSRSNGRATLVVKDNGRGLPDQDEAGETTGFGITLINALTDQLGGEFAIEDEEGARATVEFPVSEKEDG